MNTLHLLKLRDLDIRGSDYPYDTRRYSFLFDRSQKLLKIAGICSILCVLVCLSCIVLSIYSASWFRWTENWLSELGGSFGEAPLWSARGVASVIFNSGCALAGLFGILCVYAIKKSQLFSSRAGRLGTSLLFFDMCALVGIGVFPITVGTPHFLSSFIFFSLIPLFLFVISFEVRILFGYKWWWGLHLLCGIALGAEGVFLFVPRFFGCHKAIAEMVMFCSLFIFCLAFGIRLLQNTRVIDGKESVENRQRVELLRNKEMHLVSWR